MMASEFLKGHRLGVERRRIDENFLTAQQRWGLRVLEALAVSYRTGLMPVFPPEPTENTMRGRRSPWDASKRSSIGAARPDGPVRQSDLPLCKRAVPSEGE